MSEEIDNPASTTGEDIRPQGARVLGRIVARAGASRPGGVVPIAVPRPVATPERALATAVGRAAEKAYRLAMRPTGIAIGRVDLAELPELLPERALIVIVEGPSEALGVVALGPSLVASLIEVQTLGRLSGRPVEERRPTRTDAAICAEFINRMLSDLGQELAGVEGFANATGFRYASFIEDARPLPLLLEDGGFLRMRATLGIGIGKQREGELDIVLPQGRRDIAPLPEDAVEAEAQPTGGNVFGDAVRRNAMAVPMQMEAFLCQVTLSLRVLRNLREGSTIALPQDALSNAWLRGPDGVVLFHGKLGEANGLRALRVSASDEDASAAGEDFAMPGFDDGGEMGFTADAFDEGSVELSFEAEEDQPEPPIDDLRFPDEFRNEDEDGEAAGEELAPLALKVDLG